MTTKTIECTATDTFCGDPNYSWVDKWTLPAKTTNRGIVRSLKAAMGLTGKRALVSIDGSGVTVEPVGRRAPCVIGFATWS